MTRMKLAVLIVTVLYALDRVAVDSFVTPVPVGARGRALLTTGATTTSVGARPQQRTRAFELSRRQASMSAAPGMTPSSGSSGVSGEKSTLRKEGRLSRFSGRVRKMIRKAIMGYVPEEEVSYKERTAQEAAAAAKLRGEPELADERLRDASTAAKAAAIDTVNRSLVSGSFEVEGGVDVEKHIEAMFGDQFVEIDYNDPTPFDEQLRRATIRRRLERSLSLPADTTEEQEQEQDQPDKKDKKRLSMEQQKGNTRSSRPPSSGGDASPSSIPGIGAPKDGMRPGGSKQTPKLASPEDVERLNRMFGYMGGEPLR